MPSEFNSGTSMIPLILPKDKLFISRNKNLKLNDIAVFRKNNRFIAHRVIYFFPDKKAFVTKGDNNTKADGQIKKSQLLGIAKGVKRGNKEILFSHTYLSQSSSYLKELEKINTQFRRKKLEYILLKGLPLHLYYEKHVPKRLYFDADLLVKKSDFLNASKILKKLGFELENTQFAGKKIKKFTQATFIKNSIPFATAIDLHTQPAIGFTKAAEFNKLIPSLEIFTKYLFRSYRLRKVGKTSFPILNSNALVLYLLLHFFHHNFQGLHRMELIKHLIRNRKVNLNKTIFLAKMYGFENFIYTSLSMIKKYFPNQKIPEEKVNFPIVLFTKFFVKLSSPFDDDSKTISRFKRVFFVFFYSKVSFTDKLALLFSLSSLLLYSSALKSLFLRNKQT